jgi:flagellar biosynthesis protein FliQ
VVAGSLVMILGALAVGTAVATEREHTSINDALLRECCRYGLNYDRVVESYRGDLRGKAGDQRLGHAWWDYVIVAAAVGVFVYLGVNATIPALGMDFTWLSVLVAVLVAAALGGGWGLWKVTRFS